MEHAKLLTIFFYSITKEKNLTKTAVSCFTWRNPGRTVAVNQKRCCSCHLKSLDLQ